MTAPQPITPAEIRLASYYVRMLAQAKALFEQDVQSAMLANNLLMVNWSQIEFWQSRVAKNRGVERSIAKLTSDFARFGYPIVNVILPPHIGIYWQETGLTCARALGDLTAELAHLEALTAYYSVLGVHDQAMAYGDAALALAKQLNDEHTPIRVMESLGNSLTAQGKYDLARHAYETILAYSVQWSDEARIIDGLSMLGYLFLQMNDYHQARLRYEQCLELQLQRGNTLGAVRYYGQLCFTVMLEGDLPKARDYALKSIAVFRSFQDQHTLLVGENRQNYAEIEFDGSANTTYFERSLRISQMHGRPEVISIVIASYGQNLLQTGNLDAAYPLLLQSRDIAVSIGFKQILLTTLCCLAYIHCKRGNVHEAETALREALEVLSVNSGDYLQCRVLEAAVYLYSLYGTTDTSEQAALWIGLLETQTVLEQFSRSELGLQRGYLETRLGFEQMATLISRGALMPADTEIAHLKKALNASL